MTIKLTDAGKTIDIVKEEAEQAEIALRARRVIEVDGSGELSPSQKSAFGEQAITELTPIVQDQFAYSINNLVIEQRNNGGTITSDNNRIKLSTGASANQAANAVTRVPIKYNPGQGGLARFTTIYTTGVANSTQLHGVGNESDGFFFGYNGADFGILRRSGGSPKIVQLIVTTKATSSGTVTITLDGDAGPVEVTDATAGDTTTTANDIAAGDFSGVGTGWRTFSNGSIVTFVSYDAAVHGGSYSFADTDTTGGAVAAGVTNVVTGVAPIDVWVTQTNWNLDTMDGTGPSGMTLDQTKGNIYQIRYQWLGFGTIGFWIEQDGTNGSSLIKVHQINYANSATLPSIQNPTLPICLMVKNAANTSDLVMFSSSIAGFVEGKRVSSGPRHGASVTSATFTSGVETPVLTIRNKEVYQGQENRAGMKLTFVGVSQDSTKTTQIMYTFDATLTGASFSDINSDSIAEKDSSATGISGGAVAFSQGLGRTEKTVFELGRESVFLRPGQTLTVSIIPNAANPDVVASFNWVDDF